MDNRYSKYGCPGIFIDSRNLTNYYPHRTFEQFIRGTNSIGSAHDYKTFLQQNGNTIMERESDYIIKNNTCAVNGMCTMNDVPVKKIDNTFSSPMYSNMVTTNVPAPTSEKSTYASLSELPNTSVTNKVVTEIISEGYTLHPNTFAKMSA